MKESLIRMLLERVLFAFRHEARMNGLFELSAKITTMLKIIDYVEPERAMRQENE